MTLGGSWVLWEERLGAVRRGVGVEASQWSAGCVPIPPSSALLCDAEAKTLLFAFLPCFRVSGGFETSGLERAGGPAP